MDITTSGVYQLANDIQPLSGTCITISASNVILIGLGRVLSNASLCVYSLGDSNVIGGFTFNDCGTAVQIAGTGNHFTGSDINRGIYCINVEGANLGVRDVTVTDCMTGVQIASTATSVTTSQFVRADTGIIVHPAAMNTLIDSNTFTDCETGVQIVSQKTQLTNCAIVGGTVGVLASSATDAIISGNSIRDQYANSTDLTFDDIAGIIVEASQNFLITKNYISGLSTVNDPRREGGEVNIQVVGIYVKQCTDGTIQSNTISDITGKNSLFYYDGGDAQGLYLDTSFNIKVDQNTISDIRGGFNGEQAYYYQTVGGNAYGIYAIDTSAHLTSNQISSIVAGYGGYSPYWGTTAATGGVAVGIYANLASIDAQNNGLTNIIGGAGGNGSDPEANAGNGGNAYGILGEQCEGFVNNNTNYGYIAGGAAGYAALNSGNPGQEFPATISSIGIAVNVVVEGFTATATVTSTNLPPYTYEWLLSSGGVFGSNVMDLSGQPRGSYAVEVRSVVTGVTAIKGFDYNPAYQVYNVTPHILPTSGGRVTITGENFGPAEDIRVVFGDGINCTVIQVNNSVGDAYENSTLVCNVEPGGAGADLSLTITIGSQSTNVSDVLSYYPPIVTSVSDVPTSGGNITITGSNFGTLETPLVNLGGTECTVVSSDVNSIICTVPAGNHGPAVPVYVSSGGQQNNETTVSFSYAAPTITSYSQDVQPGTYLEMCGTSFGTISQDLVLGMVINDYPYNCSYTTIYIPHTCFRCLVPDFVGQTSSISLFFGSENTTDTTHTINMLGGKFIASYGVPYSAGGSIRTWIPVGFDLQASQSSGAVSLGAPSVLVFPNVDPHHNKTLAVLWSANTLFGAAILDQTDVFTFPSNVDSQISGYSPKPEVGRIVAAFYGINYLHGKNASTNNLVDVTNNVRNKCLASLQQGKTCTVLVQMSNLGVITDPAPGGKIKKLVVFYDDGTSDVAVDNTSMVVTPNPQSESV
eukprot:Phypoly_transcript_01652.p1 GENE.Phypoly_transcript_01652~~Phypoly_transcript_01652.p1  ORF type:complete len:1071 (+),score=122.64 Phypoly_transcript_01652:274-3213(+)